MLHTHPLLAAAALLQAFYVGAGRSHSEQLLYIHSGSAVTSETSFLSADDPTGNFTVILPRTQDVEYSVSHHPGSSSSSSKGKGGVTGWFLVVYRDPSKPNSELRVAPVGNPTEYKVLITTVGCGNEVSIAALNVVCCLFLC